MIPREISQEINLLKEEFRVLTVIGPRQAGKTTLCRHAFPEYRYVSLEDPDTRRWAIDDPRSFLKTYDKKVILDEIQRTPEIISYLQGIVDQSSEKAQFVLTGSNQLALSAAVSQSLAGRTALLTLLPLSYKECYHYSHNDSKISNGPAVSNTPPPPATTESIMLKGFMPGRLVDDVTPNRFYRAYFQTYVERDVRELLQIKDLIKFENFIRLCAGRIGQLLNQSALATEVGVATSTIGEWLSVLESSYIIRRLSPYYENFGKRITKSPKLYFVDIGLAAWLLGIETEQQMRRDPLRGNLFENLVVMEAFKAKLNQGQDPQLYFFRDSHGNEVDLVIAGGGKLIPCEIKASATFHSRFKKGLTYFKNLTPSTAQKGLIIYDGEQDRQTEDFDVINYRSLGARLR